MKSIHLSNLKVNSSEVMPGDVFFAIKGDKFDGNNFIEDALKRGASLVITEDKTKHAENVTVVDNVLRTLSEYANNLAQPQPINIVAATGTNGKTSVVHFFRNILEELGVKAASIGTIGVVCGDKSTPKLIQESCEECSGASSGVCPLHMSNGEPDAGRARQRKPKVR